MRAISIRSRTARPDFKGPTLQAGFISCDRKAGFVILHGKTRRPVPCRSRRNIPIPPGPKLGTGAIRRDGDITHGRQDATGFHRFVWIVGNAPRIGIKRGRGVSPTPQVIGNPKLEAVLRPCRVPPKNKRDITRTDNHYTSFKPSRKRFLCLWCGIKSCLPFIVMSVGYAEL